tara:strand:+ start:441 stop:683 length:243 start_codon:yes stop_codon:yes gene_type:complete
MKFRNSLVVGFTVGYVLGAKAGKQRYEQILNFCCSIAGHPSIRQIVDEARELAESSTERIRQAIGDQFSEASTLIRTKAD